MGRKTRDEAFEDHMAESPSPSPPHTSSGLTPDTDEELAAAAAASQQKRRSRAPSPQSDPENEQDVECKGCRKVMGRNAPSDLCMRCHFGENGMVEWRDEGTGLGHGHDRPSGSHDIFEEARDADCCAAAVDSAHSENKEEQEGELEKYAQSAAGKSDGGGDAGEGERRVKMARLPIRLKKDYLQ